MKHGLFQQNVLTRNVGDRAIGVGLAVRLFRRATHQARIFCGGVFSLASSFHVVIKRRLDWQYIPRDREGGVGYEFRNLFILRKEVVAQLTRRPTVVNVVGRLASNRVQVQDRVVVRRLWARPRASTIKAAISCEEHIAPSRRGAPSRCVLKEDRSSTFVRPVPRRDFISLMSFCPLLVGARFLRRVSAARANSGPVPLTVVNCMIRRNICAVSQR